MTDQKTAIAVREPSGQALNRHAFEPNNLDGSIMLADKLAKSNVLPSTLRGKPMDVLAVMLKGRELGLTVMQSLTQIYVVEGRPTMSAELLTGLVLRSSRCVYFSLVASDDKVATYETQREGAPKPVTMSYTIQQASGAGLANKSNWKNHTAAMLRARASAALARTVYPDVTSGLLATEELQDGVIDVTPQAPRYAPPVVAAVKEIQAAPVHAVPDPPDMNPETGEVPMPEAEVVADAHLAPEVRQRVAYWAAEFAKAPNVEVLRVLGKGMEGEPDDIKQACREAWMDRADELRRSQGGAA